jgi:hypothetical protein
MSPKPPKTTDVQPPEQSAIIVTEMLTPTEIEELKQEKKAQNAYEKEAFAHLKPRT